MIRLFPAVLALCFFSSTAAADSTVTRHFDDNGAALVNPMMGWRLNFYSNMLSNYGSTLAFSDTLDDFPGLSCIYMRLPWVYIEAEEGVFDWSVVDAPAQRWIDKGLQVAFRFCCSESWLRYATQQWVKDAGAKGYDFVPGQGIVEDGVFWEPDYNDPIFLDKLEKFVKAAAARYDGNPHVAFVDVGSFGVWGEGHTDASTRILYPADVVKKHIDLYARHFKKTLLAANDDFSFQGDTILPYAFEKGLTLCDDSILVQPPPNSYYSAALAQPFWPVRPVILEHQHYDTSKSWGAWHPDIFLRAIEEYHAAYMCIHWFPREFLEQERELIDRVNLRLGYRLQVREVQWQPEAHLHERISFRSSWANAGVAPCYPHGWVAYTLKDAQGGIAAVFADEHFDMFDLPVGAAGSAVIKETQSSHSFAPNMPPGKYDLFISAGLRDGTPVIALPLEKEDGHRRYFVGTMTVLEAKTGAPAEE